jgi:hypothetical protein
VAKTKHFTGVNRVNRELRCLCFLLFKSDSLTSDFIAVFQSGLVVKELA